MMEISASLLGADLLRLGEEIELARSAGARWIHLDNMDGHFVPNISFGPKFVRAVRRKTDMFLDVHLMFEHPLSYIDDYVTEGADMLTVHVEAKDDPRRALEAIASRGVKAGISLNPDTPVQALEPYLPLCDMVLVMTVQPGFGGQSLREDCVAKVAKAREMIARSGRPILLEVDGGIKRENAGRLLRAGADVLVMGTGFFRVSDPRAVVADVMKEARSCGL